MTGLYLGQMTPVSVSHRPDLTCNESVTVTNYRRWAAAARSL